MFRSHLPIAITAALFAFASTAATAAPPIAIQTKATDAAASGFYRMPLGKFTVIALADGNFDMPADRKSVVEGKSVSVRVGLGGRSLIKNIRDITKQTQSQRHTHGLTLYCATTKIK